MNILCISKRLCGVALSAALMVCATSTTALALTCKAPAQLYYVGVNLDNFSSGVPHFDQSSLSINSTVISAVYKVFGFKNTRTHTPVCINPESSSNKMIGAVKSTMGKSFNVNAKMRVSRSGQYYYVNISASQLTIDMWSAENCMKSGSGKLYYAVCPAAN